MKKSIKGRRWTVNSPQKTVLNEVLQNETIHFYEKDTKDTVKISISLKENQYALYSEEYLPDTITADGHKKVDITTLIIDEKTGKGKYYLADVKSDIGGKEVIFHLCEQWNDGLKYLNYAIICYLSDNFEMEEHLMVITRDFDIGRIRRAIDAQKREIEKIEKNAESLLIAAKIRAQSVSAMRKKCEILENFANYKFCYKDKWKVKEYFFEVGELKKLEDDTYMHELSVAL